MTTLLQVLRLLGPGLCALGVGLACYVVVAAPSRPSVRLGTRGLKRTRSVQASSAWRELEPVVRWLGVRVEPLLGEALRARLDRQIVVAGDVLGLLPEELVALTGILCSVGCLGGMALGWTGDRSLVLYALLGGTLGMLAPYLTLVTLQEERSKSVRNGLPCVIDLLSLALSAGVDFPGAIRQVVSKTSNPNDPLIEELNVILYELSVGKTRKDALLGMAHRVPIESVRDFVAAVAQAEERGTPLEEVLRIQAQSSRERRSVLAEEAAARAGAKMFGPIIIIFLVVMMLILVPLGLGIEQSLFQE